MTDMLKNRKDKKMSPNLSTDKQLIQISQEDVTLKRELLDKMEKSDQEFKASFTELNKTMATIGTAIQQSVVYWVNYLTKEYHQQWKGQVIITDLMLNNLAPMKTWITRKKIIITKTCNEFICS